ncbi:gp53-like domain-containing protein [Proteus mirabilis]|uniref:gp53-like domain-containing protein n=1 Tax=Proteus mirabilis TaxID=584 RepID=UPI00391CF4C0
MTKIFKIPFATQGDKTVVPVEIQTDGSVSYTQGYGYDYERDQVTDPAAKDIEREKMNSLFHDITESIGEMQLQGFAKWSEAGKPYAIRSVVYHNNKVWQSKIENNNIEPIAGNAWAELKADITANEVGAYNKAEADKRFQPVGKYQVEGYSYAKAESDTKYQPKGNYLATGYSYSKSESDGKYQPKGNYLASGYSYSKGESDGKYQPKGSYSVKNQAKKTDNGWWKCGDTGIIYQWGNSGSIPRDSDKILTFPLLFPNKCLSVIAVSNKRNYDPYNNGVSVINLTNKNFTITHQSYESSYYWFAIGF